MINKSTIIIITQKRETYIFHLPVQLKNYKTLMIELIQSTED